MICIDGEITVIMLRYSVGPHPTGATVVSAHGLDHVMSLSQSEHHSSAD